ncbi:MAG: hypothetical protein IJZ85_00165 [Lachnospiraceae bacterium]|nr:hypothetical protein [Lachnospiraceae bacterium]
MLIALSLSLALTLLFEEAFALLRGLRVRSELLLVALVNVLTNPPLVFIHYITALYLPMTAPFVLLILEIAAVIIEWRCYYHYSDQIHHPFLFSLTANLFSFGLGCLINHLIF